MKALLLAPMGSVHRRFNGVNIEALQELGFEVHLVANFEQGDGPEQQNQEYVKKCIKNGIMTHSLPYQRHEIKENSKLIKSTRDLINKEGFDLVHAHTETGGLILRLVGSIKGKKVYSPHGMSFYKGAPLKAHLLYKPIERWICNGMDCNIAINKEEMRTLEKWNPHTAFLVHGTGLDVERFQKRNKNRVEIRKELGIPEKAKVVLSVGELDDNKNHIIVIKALRHINGIYYLICGVGPNEEKLRNAGLADRLILAGYRKDIPDIIGASDVFAFPSFHEGLPVAIMEAMAGGLPVVCSNIRGNNDLIKNGKNGYTVKNNDILEWKSAIEEVLQEETKRKKFTENSYNVIKTYANANVLEELKKIYIVGRNC